MNKYFQIYMDFKKTYNNTPESIKLSFLDALIDQNQRLQEEFTAYVQAGAISKNKLSYEKFTSIVNNVQAEMFFLYCNEEYPGNPHFSSHFEHLLISMAEKCSNANALLGIYNESGIGKEIMPELTLVLNKLSGNKAGWLQSALQFYQSSEPVAKELLSVYPEFCLQRIAKMVTSTLQNERGRHVYERICELLNLAKTIPGFKQETTMLIQQTYTHKPNLPALRYEMGQAGLVE